MECIIIETRLTEIECHAVGMSLSMHENSVKQHATDPQHQTTMGQYSHIVNANEHATSVLDILSDSTVVLSM